MTEPIPITELTFGVEFEVLLPPNNNGGRGRDAIAAALVAAGLPAQHDPLSHRPVPYWRITTDSTIGYENAEIVSPSRGDFLMRGEAGFEMLRKAVGVISDFGCTVNRSCGTHVHVGVRGQEYERLGFFKELLKTYSKFEPVFDSLMARSRRESNNSMCRPITFTRDAENATTIDGLLRCYGLSRQGNDRHYAKLNLGAYIRHGTVEFRQHQGTTNSQKIENWVKLCLRMVAHAARNTERAGTSGEFVPPGMPLLPPPPRPPGGHIESRQYYATDGLNGRNYYNSLIRQALEWGIHEMAVNGAMRTIRTRSSGFSGSTGRNMINALRAVLAVERARREPAEQPQRDYETAVAEHTATVTRMRAEHSTAVEAARRAYDAARGPAAVVSRPPTDGAPATLEGLLSLVSAVESERAYFTERQMELN